MTKPSQPAEPAGGSAVRSDRQFIAKCKELREAGVISATTAHGLTVLLAETAFGEELPELRETQIQRERGPRWPKSAVAPRLQKHYEATGDNPLHWRLFYLTWWARFGAEPRQALTLVRMAIEEQILEGFFGAGAEDQQKSRLVDALRKHDWHARGYYVQELPGNEVAPEPVFCLQSPPWRTSR